MRTRLFAIAASAAAVAALLAPTAGAQPAGTWHTTVELVGGGPEARAALPEGATTDLTREFRSTKPNGLQELENYLKAPKTARHTVRASEAVADSGEVSAADAVTPNPVTLAECREVDVSQPGRVVHWYKDRFNSCTVARVGIVNWLCQNGTCRNMGELRYRLVIIGHGPKGMNPDGSRTMKFQLFTDQGGLLGSNPPPTYERVYHGLKCLTYVNIPCRFAGNAYSDVPTVGEVRDGWASPVYTLVDNNTTTERDNKVYYDLSFRIRAPNGFDLNDAPVQVVRSDTAPYVGNGGFVFMDVDSWIAYNFADRDMYEQVRHIWDAHNDIAATKPGDPFTKVAGSRNSGHKLTRMSAEYESTRYNRNNYIAVLECKKHWGDDYATNRPDIGPRECDEYPFRSTYEGAAWTEYDGGAGIWSYSARAIPENHNRLGGLALNGFYTRDHIIHGDTFWVDVHGQPDDVTLASPR